MSGSGKGPWGCRGDGLVDRYLLSEEGEVALEWAFLKEDPAWPD